LLVVDGSDRPLPFYGGLPMPFTFENLLVYQKSLDLVQHIETLSKSLKGHTSFSLLDQFTRAGLSVPLNIAEGNGRWHKNDKKQFLGIAQGSVFEMVPIVQVLKRRGLIDATVHDALYQELEALAKMLTALIKSVDELNR
jgi:four helix bundle protein